MSLLLDVESKSLWPSQSFVKFHHFKVFRRIDLRGRNIFILVTESQFLKNIPEIDHFSCEMFYAEVS